MPARKRYSAFEDFPTGSNAPQPAQPLSPLAGKAASEPPPVERIERLHPSQMLPDRFQPRRLLPNTIRSAFFSGQIDCYQAAAEWQNMARSDPGMHAEVERLLAMGSSFDEHGQIKAITGAWAAADNGGYIFQIETGERRFWAACLQRVSTHTKEEPSLRVETVANPTRQRQVLENRHSEPPSAVGQACEVSSLILAELGINPPADIQDEYEYFRQARAQRMPSGLWDRLMPVMQLTRPRMVQLLNILQLPSPLLELADRYRLPERVLREVLSAPQVQWERTLRYAIQNQLTSDEVAEVALGSSVPSEARRKTKERSTVTADPAKMAVRSIRRFAFILNDLDPFGQAQALDEIADTLVSSQQAEGILQLLEELQRLVRARTSRR